MGINSLFHEQKGTELYSNVQTDRTEQHNTTADLKLKKSRSSNGKENNGSNGITWRITTAREARTIT